MVRTSQVFLKARTVQMNRPLPPRRGLSIFPLLLLMATLFAPLGGCSDDDGGRSKVTGEISFDGQPLEGGWIHFRPVGRGPSAAGQIRQGHFEIPSQKGLTAGTYQVAIEYQKPTGRMKRVYTGEQIEETKQIIPPQFNERTTLSAEIQARGTNHLSFDLTSN